MVVLPGGKDRVPCSFLAGTKFGLPPRLISRSAPHCTSVTAQLLLLRTVAVQCTVPPGLQAMVIASTARLHWLQGAAVGVLVGGTGVAVLVGVSVGVLVGVLVGGTGVAVLVGVSVGVL